MLFTFSSSALILTLFSIAVSASPTPHDSATTLHKVHADLCTNHKIDGQDTYEYCCRNYDVPKDEKKDSEERPVWFGKECKPILTKDIKKHGDDFSEQWWKDYCPRNDLKLKTLIAELRVTSNPMPSVSCCLPPKVSRSRPQHDRSKAKDRFQCVVVIN